MRFRASVDSDFALALIIVETTRARVLLPLFQLINPLLYTRNCSLVHFILLIASAEAVAMNICTIAMWMNKNNKNRKIRILKAIFLLIL